MSVKLLESINSAGNEVVINPADGAALNLLAAAQKDGRVYGATITCSDGVFTATAGLLIARGFRIRIDSSTTILDLSSNTYASTSTKYRLVARISRTGDDANVTFAAVSTNASINVDWIERSAGAYDLVCGTFYVTPTSHGTNYEDALATVTGASSSSGSGSTSSLGKALPAPRLEIVSKAGGYRYLCIKNLGDYTGLTSKYTVKIRLWQFLKRVKRRYPSSTNSVKFRKTGWMLPDATEKIPNWRKTKLATASADLECLWTIGTRLNIVNFESASATYTRRDVLLCIDEEFIDKLFYWEDNQNEEYGELHPMSEFYEYADTYYSPATDAIYAIRCTNSRRKRRSDRGQYGKNAYNCFKKFAFEVLVYDGNKLVARSGRGDSIIITPHFDSYDDPLIVRIE